MPVGSPAPRASRAGALLLCMAMPALPALANQAGEPSEASLAMQLSNNANVSKLIRFGTQLVSLGGGVRYWADNPDSGAEGLGLRFTVTLLFPR